MAEVRDFNSYTRRKRARIVGTPKKQATEKTTTQTTKATTAQKTQKKETAPKKEAPKRKALRLTKNGAMALRTASTLAVVVVLAIISYFSWRDKVYTQTRVVASANIADAVEANCVNLNGYVLQYSRDGMSCIRPNGEAAWNRTYEMQSPIVETCGDIVAVGDYNGRTIYVADTTSPLGEIQTNLPIRSFHVASQGVVAAVLDDAEITWIHLYDAQGNELAGFRTTMGDSGYPLSVSISPNGQLVCVSYLGVEGAYANTHVAFYNFGTIGQNYTDNFVSSYICEDSVIPRVRFLDNSHAYAIATDRMMFFTGDQIPTLKTEAFPGNEEIRAVYESDGYVGVVFSGGSDEGAYRLQVYNAEGALQYTKYLDHEYEGVFFSDRQTILYDSGEWRVISMEGKDRYEGAFDYTVRAVIPTDVRSRFLLVSADLIQTVELR